MERGLGSYEHWLLFQKTVGLAPSTHMPAHNHLYSTSKRSDALFWTLQSLRTGGAQMCRQNILRHQ